MTADVRKKRFMDEKPYIGRVPGRVPGTVYVSCGVAEVISDLLISSDLACGSRGGKSLSLTG